jgi:uncharacterized membrane protein
MKHSVAVLLLLAMALPAAAQDVKSVDISFDLATSSVRQTITIDFTNETTGEINYTLGAFARDVAVTDGSKPVEYKLVNENGIEILVIQTQETRKLVIDYTVVDVVFRSDSVHHFFTEVSFDADRITARAKLPAGFGLYDQSYKPEGADIVSDGQRVILLWNSLPSDVFFSIKFVQLNHGTPVIAHIAALLVIAIVAFYVYHRRRVKEEFVKGFRDDERKVIEYMQQHKYALQRDIQKLFAFSRAKATRIIYTLEKKGLLRKKRYGRTNKLYWTKK